MSSSPTTSHVSNAKLKLTSNTLASWSTVLSLLRTVPESSNITLNDGIEQDIKPSTNVEVDLGYGLRRWIGQKAAEEPFTAIPKA
jgi:hypothetical protein